MRLIRLDESVKQVIIPGFDRIREGVSEVASGDDASVYARKDDYDERVEVEVYVGSSKNPDTANLRFGITVTKDEDEDGNQTPLASEVYVTFVDWSTRRPDEATWSASFTEFEEDEAIETFDRGVKVLSKIGLPLDDEESLMDALAATCDDLHKSLRLLDHGTSL